MLKDSLLSIKNELPSDVKLVAVSKFHPVQSIEEALFCGHNVFGESRPQEFLSKVRALQGRDIQWHFIGHLQTNKLKMVLPYAALVQSVDSLHLLESIDRWGRENSRAVNILLEVHIGAEETKSGFAPDEILSLLDRASDFAAVRFCGLMGMATNTDDGSVVRQDFSRIRSLFDAIKEKFPEMTSFGELSIGMSDDWRIALEFNPTIVRIGTAIFGPREY